MRGCPQASPSGTSPGGEGDFRWTLASLRPAVTPPFASIWVYTPSGLLVSHGVWVFLGWSQLVCKLCLTLCVWRVLPVQTDTHRHTHIHILTEECVFSGVHIAWSMMWWLASHWKASLFVPIASRHLMWHTQNDTDSVKSTGCAYNSNLHCTCFWITAQFPLNHEQIIMTQIIWMQTWHRPNQHTDFVHTVTQSNMYYFILMFYKCHQQHNT